MAPARAPGRRMIKPRLPPSPPPMSPESANYRPPGRRYSVGKRAHEKSDEGRGGKPGGGDVVVRGRGGKGVRWRWGGGRKKRWLVSGVEEDRNPTTLDTRHDAMKWGTNLFRK